MTKRRELTDNVLMDPRYDGKGLRLAYTRLFAPNRWRAVQRTFGLGDREIQVAILLVKGRDGRQAADKLHMAYNTYKQHVKRIEQKLAVHNSRQAVVKMILATGIITADTEADYGSADEEIEPTDFPPVYKNGRRMR